MAVTITGGVQVRRAGTFQSQENLAGVTSTSTQTISLNTDVSTIVGPTATITNFYTLAAGHEGQEKLIIYNTTGTGGGTTASSGDVQIAQSNAAAEGSVTFRQVDQMWFGKYMNGNWHTLARTSFEEGTSSASGAIPLTVDTYVLTGVTGTDQAFTLADGFEGQELTLFSVTGTTVRDVTPSSFREYTTLLMGNEAGLNTLARWAKLQFARGEWTLMSPASLGSTATDPDTAAWLVS